MQLTFTSIKTIFILTLDDLLKWLILIWRSRKSAIILSLHLGKKSDDPDHIDYVPTVFLFNKKCTGLLTDRYMRGCRNVDEQLGPRKLQQVQ